MAYEKYKAMKSKEEYLKDWTEEELRNMTEDVKNLIYKRYVVKCVVFQRDEFKCQNEGCNKDSALTMHHIKFQKNNGEDKPKNCITICKSCHKNFHRGKDSLTFWGMTYKLHNQYEPTKKELAKQAKLIRKMHKIDRVIISWDMVKQLLDWLYGYKDINYCEGEDD